MESSIKEFAHLQIPLEDVLKATNNFDDRNIIGKGGFGNVYKGNLMKSGELIKIAARRLDCKQKQGHIEFWNEISVLSNLKHENLVSVIGFCDEKDEKIIINSYSAKGSLWMHLSKPTLTWIQRLNICIGIASALHYIHNKERTFSEVQYLSSKKIKYKDGRSYSVTHRNINSSTILLDDKFEAKLSGFEYSIKYSVHQRNQCVPKEAIGTTGYMDPTIEKAGGVTHKSDTYSFGVVLWEILCGRKAYIPNEDEDNRYLASLARFHYEEGTLDHIIHLDLRNQVSQKSLNRVASTAYDCLKDEQVHRPNMDKIVMALEDALNLANLKKHYEYLEIQLTDLKIRLSDIVLATDNFSRAYLLRDNKYHEFYRVELDHFDKVSGHLPKRRNPVVLKRFLLGDNSDGEREFFRELKLYTTCKHENIVSLLGFCDEGSEMILVFEYVSNGSLKDYLKNIKDMSVLTWGKRLQICLDVAHAIKYLHYEMKDQNIIEERFITSEYIALDENRRAKIVDFGHSTYFRYSFVNLETKCYVDPETGKFKRGLDVDSFGEVLLKVLCGRAAYDDIYRKKSYQRFANVARRCYEKGRIEEMVDPIIKEESGLNKDSLHKFIEIALKCVSERPTMNVVVKELEQAVSLQEEQEQRPNKDHIFNEFEDKSLEGVTQPNLDMDEVDNTVPANKLEHLKIPLSEITLATNNFSKEYHIDTTEHYYTYKAELDHYDKLSRLSIEGKNNDEPSKRRNTVCIRRLIHREDRLEKEVFFREIEMLTTCKHENIVTLLGFCVEGYEMILVVEHTSNGYLHDYLKNIKEKHTLTWARRLKICLDVARGLKYLHYEMEDQKTIINHCISSSNIVLDENLVAKIRFFGYSRFLSPNQVHEVLHHNTFRKMRTIYDSEFEKTRKLKRESDVYGLGFILFEILFGRSFFDKIDSEFGPRGMPSVVWQRFHEGTLMQMIDPMINDGGDDYSFALYRGPNKNSLDTFIKIAYECSTHMPDQRPTIEVVVKELEKALIFHENNKDDPRFSLEDITKATGYFDDGNRIGTGGFGNVYLGKLPKGDGFDTIVAKRLDIRLGQGEQQFRNELQILFEYKHENVIRLVGYCDEKDAKVIVYEYASKGSLDRYLNDPHLTWVKRLNICIDVASALEFLHGGVSTKAAVIHRDIKTENILLNDEWKAKLGDYGLSLISAVNQETNYVIDRACGTRGYVDPVYLKSGFLTMESDIYSFGVVLFEILCGRSTFAIHKHEGQYLPSFIKQRFDEGKHNEVVFEAIKTQIVPKALTTFQAIAYRCLHDDRENRPTSKEVLEQLKKALALQQENESSTGILK